MSQLQGQAREVLRAREKGQGRSQKERGSGEGEAGGLQEGEEEGGRMGGRTQRVRREGGRLEGGRREWDEMMRWVHSGAEVAAKAIRFFHKCNECSGQQ